MSIEEELRIALENKSWDMVEELLAKQSEEQPKKRGRKKKLIIPTEVEQDAPSEKKVKIFTKGRKLIKEKRSNSFQDKVTKPIKVTGLFGNKKKTVNENDYLPKEQKVYRQKPQKFKIRCSKCGRQEEIFGSEVSLLKKAESSYYKCNSCIVGGGQLNVEPI